MQPNHLYRHPRQKDVDLFVLNISDVTSQTLVLNVLWTTRKSRRLIARDKVTIAFKNIRDWIDMGRPG